MTSQNRNSNTHNRFDILNHETECYKCQNFGHISRNCPTNFQKVSKPIYTHQQTQIWKRKTENLKAENCNVALQAEHKIKWIIDSGCSKHMTGSKHLFIKLDKGKEGSVTFGNDQTARIIGRGTVCLNSKKNLAENVLLIEDMEHNLLSVSQTCDKGCYMIFDSNGCQIRDVKTDKLIGTATRSSSNVYILDEKKNECCLSNENESWLWHKRLGHINFDNLINMSKNEAVRDLPSLKNLSGSVCKQCQHGKQTRVRFKTKEYSTTKPLEIVHTDICGPMRTKGMKGEKYFLLFVDDYNRKTWLYLLKKKSEAFDCFQTFKKFVENECDKKIKCLRSDNGGEYVSNEFNKFCDVNRIKRHFSVTKTPQ